VGTRKDGVCFTKDAKKKMEIGRDAKREREGDREGGREGGREGERERKREGGREGGREREREREGMEANQNLELILFPQVPKLYL